MKQNTARFEIDMCNGPLLTGVLRFALPLILSNVLQLAFNAADMIVVGKFSGSDTALAAVGATGSLITLIVNLFIGISTGVNVLIANYRGARRDKDLNDTVHTAMLMSLFGGFLLLFVGVCFCRTFLQWMGTPDNVIDQSTLYMRIYFLGMPFFLVYNFGAAILRALGDTQRPLLYLSLAGVLNVLLNLFFVLVLKMDVAGVALATIASQCLSAVLIVRCLMTSDGSYKLELKKLKIHPRKFRRILQIGLPAGLQSSLFAISNVLIQSSINSFGSEVMSGNTAAANIEGFVYTTMNSVAQAAISFTGQNYGAHKYKRIDQVLICCLLLAGVGGAVVGNVAYLFGPQLLSLYTNNPAEIQYGLTRMQIIACTYFLCGFMDCLCYTLRGLGQSLLPTMVSLTGACLMRVVWIYTVFALYHTQFMLYISYPISWTLTAVAHLVCYLIIRKKKFNPEPAITPTS